MIIFDYGVSFIKLCLPAMETTKNDYNFCLIYLHTNKINIIEAISCDCCCIFSLGRYERGEDDGHVCTSESDGAIDVFTCR